MFQYLPDHRRFVDAADDFHLALAMGTFQRIHLPDLLDALPPGRWRNSTRLVIGHIDNFDFVIAATLLPGQFLFGPISPHPV